MNILQKFKNNAGKMLAMTALFTMGALASNAQTQPKVTRDTLTNVKGKPIIKDGKVGTSDTLHIRTTKSLDKKTTSGKPVGQKPQQKVVNKEVPNPERKKFIENSKPKNPTQKDEDAWKDPKVRKAYYDRLNKIPKTVTVPDTIPAKDTPVAPSLNVLEEKEREKTDTVVIENNFKDTVTVNIPPLKVKRPWRLSVGPVWHNRFNAKPDPNAASLNRAPDKEWNIDPTDQQGIYARLTSPKFGKKGTFLNWFEAEAEVQIFKNAKDTFLLQHNFDEANQGPGSSSEVFDVVTNRAQLRNNLRVSVKFGPTIGKGPIKVQPYVQGGGFFQQLADVEVIEFGGVAPTRLMPAERQMLKSNQASLFGAVGASICGDISKPKVKNNVKTDRGFYFTANANAFTTTQNRGVGTAVSGYTHGGKYQWNVSGGIGFRF